LRDFPVYDFQAYNNDVQLMTPDAELTAAKPTDEPKAPSPAAERMRRHRARRLKGLRCLIVELRETEVTSLISKGLLNQENRLDNHAVLAAFYKFLDRTLGRPA
jgi:hypothetical protein